MNPRAAMGPWQTSLGPPDGTAHGSVDTRYPDRQIQTQKVCGWLRGAGWGGTTDGYGASFWADENVPELEVVVVSTPW